MSGKRELAVSSNYFWVRWYPETPPSHHITHTRKHITTSFVTSHSPRLETNSTMARKSFISIKTLKP